MFDVPARKRTEGTMEGLRRAIMALALGAVVASVLRLLGNSTNPTEHGGWQELTGTDLR